MHRLFRPALVAGLALAMLASSSVAFARGHNGGRGSGRNAWRDLAGYGWAMPGISALQAQGVLNGVSATQFDPGGATTRADMATVLARWLGWQSAAGTCGARFSDDDSIPGFARCAVGLAATRGVMRGFPSGGFMPQGDVTWAELAVILARALNYPAVAPSQVSVLLSQLPQGAATPAWAQQAVAAAVQAGAFNGLLADMYQPQGYVTRAQLAALLAQAQQSTAAGTANVLNGQVTAVSGLQVTVQTSAGTQTVPLSPTATVYVGQALGSTGSLQAGDTVTLVLAGGQVVVVNITAGPTAVTQNGTGGTITATLASVSGTQLGLTVPGVPTFYVPVAAGVSTSGLVPGQTVTVTLNSSGQAVAVSIGTGTTAGTSSVSGTVASISGDTLILTVNGTSEVFTLNGSTTVDGVLNDLGALAAGQAVTLYEASGQVTAVQINSSGATVTVTGTIASVSGTSLVLNVSGTLESYTLTAATTVDGVANDLAALAAGQTVTLTATGSQATSVQITSSGTTTTVTGTVLSLSGDTLLLNVGGTGEAFTLSGSTTVNGALNDLAALTPGVTATLTEIAGQVTAVTTNGSGATTTVTGVVSTISGYALILNVNGVSQAYTLTAATTVNGALNNLGALAPGETVTLYLSGGQVTAVTTTGNGATTTVSGVVTTISGYALILDVNGTSEAYTLTAATTVNGVANDVGAIVNGDTVTLTLVSGTVTAVQILTTPGSNSGNSGGNCAPINCP